MLKASLNRGRNRREGTEVVLLLILSILLPGCQRPQHAETVPEIMVTNNTIMIPAGSPQLTALSIEPVEARPREVVSLAGRLTWNEDATVRVFTPFTGIVRKLFVDINQQVAKGDALVELQSSDFGQAQADARKAESDFRKAEKNLARSRDLVEHGAAAGKDLEAAEADFASAQAERDRTTQRLAIYGATATPTERGFLLPSPLAGTVVDKSVTPGQEVRPDQMLANVPQYTAPLFVISDPAHLWIQIDATEADLPALRPGHEFTFTSRAFPEQAFTGRVDVISEFIDPNTRTIKVRGTVENSGQHLKAEMFVNVALPMSETSGASVPSKAVFLQGEKHYVFVEKQPGQFERREVQLGPEQDGHILVLAGVQPGQRVVTDGCILLQQSLK
jgi:cobalt-zinc-cadmium efflux system membrane fusion protein